MKINIDVLKLLVGQLAANGLLHGREASYALAPANEDFVFKQQLALADSMHLHVHVRDIEGLPQELFARNNAAIALKAEGYIKYTFQGGVNLIFSHITVAGREKENGQKNDSWLDHIGIDIRADDKNAYIVFQEVPLVSAQNDYLFVRQGDGKQSVSCCHMQVKEKYWVYPNENINYEFAFGPLSVYGAGFGVDLRPANPFKSAGESASCCSPAKPRAAIFVN